jgi:hypothetical protein
MDVQVPESPFVDHVIGTFARERLSGALAATHRAGFGPHTRVLDGQRSDAARQLERTGLHLVDEQRPAAEAIVILVTAPGRIAAVARLFRDLGAEAILFASRMPLAATAAANRDAIAPDIRIGDERVASAEA